MMTYARIQNGQICSVQYILYKSKSKHYEPNSLWCTGSFNPCINEPRTKYPGTDLACVP